MNTFNFHKFSGGSKISQTGGQPVRLGQKPIIQQNFCQKLHENGINWTEEGAPPAPPLWIRQ